MKIELDLTKLWTPLPTQQGVLEAIRTIEDLGHILYVGAFGSGKSWILCRAVIGLCLTHPKLKVIVGRQLSTDLKDTTQATFFELIQQIEEHLREQIGPDAPLSAVELGEFWKAENKYIFKKTGASVIFRPLEDGDLKYRSLNCHVVAIDEASEVHIDVVRLLASRRRAKDGPRLSIYASNPTETDHWMYKWFVERTEKAPQHTRLFRTNTLENKENLPDGYLEELMAIYPPDWVKRYLEGHWGNILQGRRPVFPTFRPDIHLRPTSWTKDRPIYVGMDYGYQFPGIVWAQINKQHQLQILRCWYPRDRTVFQLAEGVLYRNDMWFPEGKFLYFGGHDGNARSNLVKQAGLTARKAFAQYGITVGFRYHHIEQGLTTIRSLLRTEDAGQPSLIVDPICRRLSEGFVSGYCYDAEKVEKDEDVKPIKDGRYDQLFDALRYIVVSVYGPSGSLATEAPLQIARHSPEGRHARYREVAERNQTNHDDRARR